MKLLSSKDMKLVTLFIGTLLSLFILNGCSESQNNNSNESSNNQNTEEEDLSFDDVEMSNTLDNALTLCINVHNEVNPISLPHDEKMNFDIYDPYYPLTGQEVLAFHLDTFGIDTNTFVNLDYWIDYSDNYSTYVFNIEKGEFELSTVMVNYFGDYTYIDHKEIAYDEIAESATRIESKIEKDQITIDYISYWEGEKKETKVFEIDSDGYFQEKK